MIGTLLKQFVLSSLANGELEHGLGWDGDLSASGWVATHASSAVLLYHLAETWHDEFTSTLDFAVDDTDKLVVHLASIFLRDTPGFSEGGHDL